MTNYIFVAIFAYSLFAVNAVIDKFLLHKRRIGHPATYAFTIGMLSLAVLVLAPFGLSFSGWEFTALALTAGMFFTFALFLFFSSLKIAETSRVVPIQGGFVPFFTLILAYLVLGERLGETDIVAIGLLLGGSVLITTGKGNEGQGGERGAWVRLALGAAFLFALSFTMTKSVFDMLGFINGFIWTRFGMAIGALLMLFDPDARKAIFSQIHRTSPQTGFLFITGQIVGALAGIGQNFAIALGSVTIVNALAGTQFVFLFILTALLSIWSPKILREEISSPILVRKGLATALISAGVAILAL